MSLDPLNLRVLSVSGSEQEQRDARHVIPLVRRHHHLLVTMLILNAGICEALPLFLDRLLGPILAVVVSVSGLVLFREIIPHAYAVRHGLRIGALFRHFVWLLLVVTFPVCYPMSLLLDCALGEHEESFYRRDALKALVRESAEAEPSERAGAVGGGALLRCFSFALGANRTPRIGVRVAGGDSRANKL